MEKEHQADSMSVTIKPDYPPSEVYSTSEPPPAYRRQQSSAVQIARIAAVTVVLSSVVLGSFLLACSYVQARAGCQQLQELDALLDKELALEQRQFTKQDEFPMHAALQQNLEGDSKDQRDLLKGEETRRGEDKLQSLDDSSSNSADSSDSSSAPVDSSSSSEEEEDDEPRSPPVRITLPLQLDFDELAGALIEKNQRSRMNCVVEKRRAEQLVDHQPRSVRLPFGLNLTTDPRVERVTGERMAIFCESGNDQGSMPEGVEVVQGFQVPLGGPVSLPLHFPVRHMQEQPMPAQHMQAPAPQAPQQYSAPPSLHPRVQVLRLAPRPPMEYARQERPYPPPFAQRQFPPQFQEQPFPQEQYPHAQNMIEERVPQMTVVPREVRIHVQRVQLPHVQPEQVPQDSHQDEGQDENMQMKEMAMGMISEAEMRAVQQAVRVAEQQAVQHAVRIAEQQAMRSAEQQAMRSAEQQAMRSAEQQAMRSAEQQAMQRAEQQAMRAAEQQAIQQAVRAAEQQAVQHAVQQAVRAAEAEQENAQQQQQRSEEPEGEETMDPRHEMLGRQAMARALPVNIPVPMMITRAEETPVQDPERPHYVQPRSVRSVDSVLKKRVKRSCNCDCAC